MLVLALEQGRANHSLWAKASLPSVFVGPVSKMVLKNQKNDILCYVKLYEIPI